MNTCRQTATIVDGLLAADQLAAPGSTDHAATCDACSRAVAEVLDFDTALRDAARSFANGPVARVDVGGEVMPNRLIGSRMRLLGAVAASAAVVVGLLLIGPRVLPHPPEVRDTGPGAATHRAPDRGTAAAVMGVPPESVLITEDGALAVTTEPTRLSLVLLRAVDGELRMLTLATIDTQDMTPPIEITNRPGVAVGAAVACPGEMDLVRTRYLYGFSHHEPHLPKATLTGLPALASAASDGTYLFAIDPGDFEPGTAWSLTRPAGGELGTVRYLDDLAVNGTLTPAGCRSHP